MLTKEPASSCVTTAVTYNNAIQTSVPHAAARKWQAGSGEQVYLRVESTGRDGALTVPEISNRTRIWMKL
jgi:hypothetical protein